MLLQLGCSFALPPVDSTCVGDIVIFLKLACYYCLAQGVTILRSSRHRSMVLREICKLSI